MGVEGNIKTGKRGSGREVRQGSAALPQSSYLHTRAAGIGSCDVSRQSYTNIVCVVEHLLLQIGNGAVLNFL